jgi:putative hydrolase of the HAD superfamily
MEVLVLRNLEEIRAVLFDIDDTLFDSTTLAKMARMNAVKAMIESGLPIRNVSEGYALLVRIVDKYGPNYDQHFDRLLETLHCKRDARIVAAGVVAYHDTKLAYIRPDPGVMPTLMALRDKGCKLGVISNGISVKQWEKIIRMGLQHCFHSVIISEDIGCEKPDRKIFVTALEELKVEAREAMYVGDQPEIDAKGANEAGLVSVLLVKRRHKEPMSDIPARPHLIVREISELLGLVKTDRQILKRDSRL